MKGRQVGRVNQPSKGEVPLVSGVLQRAAVRAVADKEVEATEEAESETLRESRFRHDFSQVGIDRGGLPPIQAKLTIGEPGNKYEQEADRVAAQVVQQINAPASVQSSKGQSVQRTEAPDEEEIQAKPEKTSLQRMEAISGGEASKDLESAINSARGGGQPLEAGLQRTMGQAMGADFSGVKVYTDAVSDKLNQSMQAKAFTTGPDVFFRQGAYDPGSPGGQELIAHELTHVVQQQGVSRNRSARMLMRAIRKDKLNVVGENHEESDERRQGEKDYCLEKAGKANYWTEREFAVRDFRPWDWMADKREKADPWELRIRHQVQMIYEMGINGASGVECWGDSLWNRLKGVEREVRNMELELIYKLNLKQLIA